MKPKLISVIVGVTFRKAFRLLDCTGAIFDKLLYNSNYFSPQYFPQIEYGGFQKELQNKAEGHYLRLFADGVIYCHCLQKANNEETEITTVINRVEKAIVPTVLDTYELELSRIGIVYTLEIDKKMLDRFKKKYFKEGVDVSAFRFSISSPTSPGIMKKGIEDYYNTIYTISQDGDRFVISLDFQEYFRPLKPSWRECKAGDFYESARKAYAQLLKELE